MTVHQVTTRSCKRDMALNLCLSHVYVSVGVWVWTGEHRGIGSPRDDIEGGRNPGVGDGDQTLVLRENRYTLLTDETSLQPPPLFYFKST